MNTPAGDRQLRAARERFRRAKHEWTLAALDVWRGAGSPEHVDRALRGLFDEGSRRRGARPDTATEGEAMKPRADVTRSGHVYTRGGGKKVRASIWGNPTGPTWRVFLTVGSSR